MDFTSSANTPNELQTLSSESRARAVPWAFLWRVPWWALVLLVMAVLVYVSIAADEEYAAVYEDLQAGIALTLRVAVIAYIAALVIGLVIGLIRATPPRPGKGVIGTLFSIVHLVVYNIATLFVEIVRGIPLLIVLLVFAFIIIPGFRAWLDTTFGIDLELRGSSEVTAIIALAFAYGAFLSEVFRAGIQSIEKGQREAARSLGMNYWQMMRFIVLPQALRRIIPPLGNDFIAIIKDSSLVAILGIRDITQIAKVTSGSNFKYVETYTVVVVIYLTLTILGSMVVRLMEAQTSASSDENGGFFGRVRARLRRFNPGMPG